MGRRADQAHAPDGAELLHAVHQQVVLVLRNVLDAHVVHVVDGRPQAHGVGNVAGACLELVGNGLEHRLLEGHVGNHVAAALPRGHVLQHLALAPHHANAGGPENLVA